MQARVKTFKELVKCELRRYGESASSYVFPLFKFGTLGDKFINAV